MSNWRQYASCKGLPIQHFFPDDGPEKPSAFVKALCAECPVQPQCLAEAVSRPNTEGIWGGQSTQKRRKVRYANPGTRTVQIQPHGTYARYRRHMDEGSEICGPCKQAGSDYLRKWREQRNMRTAFGTV
jgi:hypothetical protein